MFMVTHLIGFAAGGAAVTVTYADSAADATNLTTYTFSGRALGTPSPSRQVVVGAVSPGTTTQVSSVTIAGNAAASVIDAGAVNPAPSLWKVSDSTNATGDIVVTFAAGVSRCAIIIYEVHNASTTVHDTGTHQLAGGTANSTLLTDTINVAAGGAVIGFAAAGDGAVTQPWTWTELTEDVETAGEANTSSTGASKAYAGAQTGMTVTAQHTGTDARAFVLVSFAPL